MEYIEECEGKVTKDFQLAHRIGLVINEKHSKLKMVQMPYLYH